jgi:hypothetical protein
MAGDEYRPLDLSAYLNAGIDVLGGDEPPPTGRQQFHGLPFQIGEGNTAFLGFGQGLREERLQIPVGATAHTVIVAHRLLGSRIGAGAPVGLEVAEYVFRLVDGSEHRVPIRERFEIADIFGFGQFPFLARPDRHASTLPRWSGQWSNAGHRQTEVAAGWPRAYFLWCWTNPTPDVRVQSIDVVPAGPPFLIAALTLGLADEYPFVRDAAIPVRLDLKDAALASQPLTESDLEVVVDRGAAGYAYALPQTTTDQFVTDPFAGWGEKQNSASSPAYAEVAAIPSATVGVKIGNETVAAVRWRDVLERHTVDAERVRIQIVEDGRNWVETVVLDDETNEPVPCRIHFRSPDGVPYQPHGHHGHVNSNNATWHVDVGGDLRLGQITYAYVDGRCQGWLPRGDVLVDVARGFEYEPLRQRITIAPGRQRLELRLRRWTNMNAQRWFSGDTHVHFLSTQGSLREARAEDLNVVNLLQSQWGSLFTNTEDFTGEPVVAHDGRTIVWANQENRQHLLGHLILLGLQQPVYPWCSDGPDEAELGGALETTLSAWADACHAQGGTVIIPHFPNPNAEPATLVATGRADAVEMIAFGGYNHLEYYRYLNAGYRLPLVGGTDKMSSEVAVGQYRTYVRIPSEEEFSYDTWCANLRRGRTFLSGGPLLELAVEGAQVGDTVHLPAGGGTVEVVATARSTIPVHTLQIVQGGHVVAQTDEPRGARTLTLRTRLPVTSHDWLCARVAGPSYEPLPHHDCWSRGVFAHTSPIYVACGGEWELANRDGLQYMLTLVEGSLQYVRQTAPRRRPGTATHHHGEADHQAYLERPFLEALAALRARLARGALARPV